jgi:hypothetical protein
MEIRDRSHPYVAGAFAPGADPVWRLEGSSYPIRVAAKLFPQRVVECRAGEAFAAIARPTAHVGSHGACQTAPAQLRPLPIERQSPT